jgi:hypothetical protein
MERLAVSRVAWRVARRTPRPVYRVHERRADADDSVIQAGPTMLTLRKQCRYGAAHRSALEDA